MSRGAAHMVSRGKDDDRLETVADLAGEHEALRSIEAEIAQLEIARQALIHDTSDRDETQSGRRLDRDQSEPARGDDLLQER